MGSLISGGLDGPETSTKAQPRRDDEVADSEWEYEYDEHETEHFYFTLDLTTRVSSEAPLKQSSRSGQSKEATATGDPRNDKRSSETPGRTPSSGPLEVEQNVTATYGGELQVLDLHTANPFVKFNSGVYSCAWVTDLGTQFFVSRPGVSKHPLRPGNLVDVVGISQARLLGKPVTLRPHNGPDSDNAEGTSSANTVEVRDDGRSLEEIIPVPSDFSTLRPGQPLIIPRDRYKNHDIEEQASFLERLSAIKLKKGETDIIPVSGVKYYEPPADQDAIRARALAAEPKEAQDVRGQPEPKRQKRPTQPKQPKQPWQSLKSARRPFADLGKETKAEKAARLAEAPEEPAPSALLLPRSQQSITSTSDQPMPSQLPYWAYPTVQYDAPSWDVEPADDSAAISGLYHGGGFDGGFDQSSEAVEMSSGALDGSMFPLNSAMATTQVYSDRMETLQHDDYSWYPPPDAASE
ncbi:hypothetical protein LTR36_008580 [Oleoguttula mirabilis]|uniref:Transcription factor TFIIIC triple barrel domain-containing protein n=1 Tax=Oleoguttula mirabilis TaxID=1507867 RepID=A0AAV9JUQ3_9PEZI|nr:hypothetical protein LTR36_008580 [Oleoguttula mirabilis]